MRKATSTTRTSHELKTTVRGHGGHSVVSWRDLGREGGHVGHPGTGAKTPWTEQGIFVQGLSGRARDGAPGLPLERRDRLENPGLKRRHRFETRAGFLCVTCNMLQSGHDRLMEKLKA